MASTQKSSISHLKEDATRMAKDLADLTQSLAEAGRSGGQELSEDLIKKFEDQLDEITSRISGLRETAKVQAEKVDQHVKSNPYLYLLGAAGLGFLLGKTLPSLRS